MATSPFTILFNVAKSIEGVVEQRLFLDQLMLDDCVHIYHMISAVDAANLENLDQLRQCLEDNGIYSFCKSIAQRMVNEEFTDDPGVKLADARTRAFNLTSFLQVGMMMALKPALFDDIKL